MAWRVNRACAGQVGPGAWGDWAHAQFRSTAWRSRASSCGCHSTAGLAWARGPRVSGGRSMRSAPPPAQQVVHQARKRALPLQPIDPMRAEWPQAVGRRRCSHKGLVLTEMNVCEVNVCYGELVTWARARRGHHLIGAAEDVQHAAAERTSLVADDGERQCWPRSAAGWAQACRSPSTSTPGAADDAAVCLPWRHRRRGPVSSIA